MKKRTTVCHVCSIRILSVLEKKWSQTQKWKSSLAKTQRLIDQVNVSSRLKRTATALSNGYHTNDIGNLCSKTKSSRLDHQQDDPASLASKAFVITVNNDSMDTDDFHGRPLRESPIPQARNEDFLVTITSGHQKSPAHLHVDEDDNIYGERQKELEADMDDNDMSQLEISPRRSRRTRTLSAKGLAYSESENIIDNLETGQAINPGLDISETPPTVEQAGQLENTETSKDIGDTEGDKINALETTKNEELKSISLNQEAIDQNEGAPKTKSFHNDSEEKKTAALDEDTTNSS